MIFKRSDGGILLYVLILWGIVVFFLSLVTIFYGSSLANIKEVQGAVQNTALWENVLKNTVYRYKHNYDDYLMHSQQDAVKTSFTRYSNSLTAFLNPQIDKENTYYWEFHKDQREMPFVDPLTGSSYNNQLDTISNWKISWNLISDTSLADVKAFNSVGRVESANLRITLLKVSPDIQVKCFNTNNNDVLGDIVSSGAFASTLTLKESYFKSTTLTNDCTQIDPDNIATLLNSDGAIAFDFTNTSFLLVVQSLDGASHVRVTAVGNNGYIPTNMMSFVLEPQIQGKSLEKEIFVGGNGSLIFSLLSDAERVYDGKTIEFPTDVTKENWRYFMQKIDEKY